MCCILFKRNNLRPLLQVAKLSVYNLSNKLVFYSGMVFVVFAVTAEALPVKMFQFSDFYVCTIYDQICECFINEVPQVLGYVNLPPSVVFTSLSMTHHKKDTASWNSWAHYWVGRAHQIPSKSKSVCLCRHATTCHVWRDNE